MSYLWLPNSKSIGLSDKSQLPSFFSFDTQIMCWLHKWVNVQFYTFLFLLELLYLTQDKFSFLCSSSVFFLSLSSCRYFSGYLCRDEAAVARSFFVTVPKTKRCICPKLLVWREPPFILTHWRLKEIAHSPSLIPWHFLEYFRVSESTKINHMRSHHKHKIRFQDVVYLKSNK